MALKTFINVDAFRTPVSIIPCLPASAPVPANSSTTRMDKAAAWQHWQPYDWTPVQRLFYTLDTCPITQTVS